ncbi:2Fe-2S iron-sulfur cluster-binding protein [Sphingobium sufflavum]|uniref:2Fe-2S iron-sulfur cluster-binding protein n=1 Tax=Sphingobium sufflavum TaxID=1129547 RepID=UPI001F4816C7|nr:2Fe-2S iron-sulfur cluster-binding protein [Sphingobium sufflavum]MCE7798862.1 2Fe-2S iron-sulfur cluster-binding protein [Sphingobium sufflavum]
MTGVLVSRTNAAIGLSVTLQDGAIREIVSHEGTTLMEAIRDAGIDEMLALCGGACACATCHVYVSEADASLLDPLSDDENELLETAVSRNGRSRLACQIRLTQQLSGLAVTVAPEE